MKRTILNFWQSSIANRVTIAVMAAELVLLVAFFSFSYRHTYHEFIEDLELVLLNNAETIASHINAELPAMPTTAEEIMFAIPQYKEHDQPDAFAVLDAFGHVITGSKKLTELPPFAASLPTAPRYGELAVQGNAYRGVIIPLKHPSAGGAVTGAVFYARSLDDTIGDMADARHFLLFNGVLFFMLSVVFVRFAVQMGLKPVHTVVKRVHEITPGRFDMRLEPDMVPTDLRPVAESINFLLERAEHALSREREFTADAAHELRTPVAILKSGIQAEMLVQRESPSALAALNSFLDDVNRLDELCEELLDSSVHERSDADSRVSLDSWMREIKSVCSALRMHHMQAGKSILLSLSEEIPGVVLTSLNTTRRIATNLVKNALVHGGANVQVRVHLENGFAVLTVSDDGPGIPAGEQEKVFERFYRIDKARARKTGGAGLGLSICRDLALHHGGKLEVFSAEPQGVSFRWSARMED